MPDDDKDRLWPEMADSILETLKEELKGFVERQEVEDFAKEVAKQTAKWMLVAKVAKDPKVKKEALENVQHLRAQIKGELARLNLNIAKDAQIVLGKIFSAVLGAVAKVAGQVF